MGNGFEDRKVSFRKFENFFDAQEDIDSGLQNIFSALLSETPFNYLIGFGENDAGNVVEVAQDILKRKDQTVFRVVFGASEQIPLRALSYLVPALEMMYALGPGHEGMPRLQVVFANNIAGRLNGLDYAKVEAETELFVRVASSFIREFFPAVVAKVGFFEDAKLEKGSNLREELLMVTRVLKSKLSQAVFEELMSKGKGASRVNPFYGAAHLLVHDANLPNLLVPIGGNNADQNPTSIISVGSLQERIFYRVRYELKDFLPDIYRQSLTLQYFTKHRVPPYFMARGGDIRLKDIVEKESYQLSPVARAAQNDLDYLERVSQKRGNYPAFLGSLRSL